MAINAEQLEFMMRWQADPVEFVLDNFGVEPDAWQLKVLNDYANNRRIAMKACKGPGKTAVLSWIGWHFLACNEDAKVTCTSITGDNLKDGLWAEFSKWQVKSPFLREHFEWKAERIKNKGSPENWFASARSWSKTATPDEQSSALAGVHADNTLFLIDEAGSIPVAVGATADATLATLGNNKMVVAGNPENTDGLLYHCCVTAGALYVVTEITADPEDPMRTPRVSPTWAQEQIDLYGRDNPWVMVNVLGKFPPGGMNVLIGPEEIEAAMKRVLPGNYADSEPMIIGADIARFGDDRTVLFPRKGRVSYPPVIMRGADSNQVSAKLARLMIELNAECCFIDDTGGWASGVIDTMKASNFNIIPINASGSPMDERYLNRRAEMAFNLADWIKTGGILPYMQELKREMTAGQYKFQKNKFQMESKDDIKKRLGYSPDLHDGLALTFAQPVLASPKATGMPMENQAQAQIDYDVLDY